jgi:methionyl-tRNA formyltransferase
VPGLRLVFMGSPDFAVGILEALIAAGHRIACVYAQPPRPAGRGQQEQPCAVHAFAQARGLPVRTPRTLKAPDAQEEFAALGADAAVVAAYGLILPKPILDAPRLGCVNVHASLLPRWRGAAPIQRAILAGDAETGVTIMKMDEGLDTGPMLLSARVPVTPTTTAAELRDALAVLGARLIVEALDGLRGGTLRPVPQPADGVTLAPKLDRGEGRLEWRRDAAALERAVRAFFPWPGAWFEHGGERIKVLAAEVAEAAGEPGCVLDDRLTIACGRASLRPLRVQKAGKAAMDTTAFLRGNPVPAGTRLA